MKLQNILEHEPKVSRDEFIYLPDIEFGKTYYVIYKKDGKTCLCGVKFYGIRHHFGNIHEFTLVGQLATGHTIEYKKGVYHYIGEQGMENVVYSYIYASKQDFSTDTQVIEKATNRFLYTLLNFLYPQKFVFAGKDIFRYCWNGVKTLKSMNKDILHPFTVFFEKPKNNDFLLCNYNVIPVESIQLGVIYEERIKNVIENFFATTYATIEECESKNRMNIIDFEGEEEESEEDSLVYITLVGPVTKECAKEILKELKTMKI